MPDQQCPLDQSACRLGGGARSHATAALHRRAERHSEAQCRFGSEVDVDEPPQPRGVAAPGRDPRLPHEVAVDDGAGLDLLERVDPHAGEHDALLADGALVADRRAFADMGVRAELGRPAECRALHDAAPAQVRRHVDDRARHARALTHGDARPEHRVRADRCRRRDPAVVADVRRAFDLAEVGDLDALAEPDVAAQAKSRNREADALLQRVEVRLPVLVEVADVLPVAVQHVAVQRPAHLEQQREQLLREVVRTVGGNVPEHLGLEHVDARVDRVGEHLAPRGLLEEPLDAAVLVGHDDAELERVVDGDEADRGRRALLAVEAHQRAEVDVAERVARDDEERVVELVPGEEDRAGRACGRLLDGVAHPHAERLPRAEVAADGLRHEGERDHDVLEAVLSQELDDVLHAGPADDRHHRLRLVRRQRAQAGALATGHHDGLHLVVLRTRTTYSIPATPAMPMPIQKSQSGQSVPAGVVSTQTIETYSTQVAALPRRLTSKT